MIYGFDDFSLDLSRSELKQDGVELSIDPKSFSLLCLLVDNHDRLITKDEIIEKVWDGRIVSEASISTALKNIRHVLGDDGSSQKYIKTLRGRGFRFAGTPRIVAQETTIKTSPLQIVEEQPASDKPRILDSQPSIAILPFELIGFNDTYAAIAEAIPAELISNLSKLRWLKVIARGSTFRFNSADFDIATIRSSLGANYCLSGAVEIFGSNIAVTAELSDTRSLSVIWGERFTGQLEDVLDLRAHIAREIVTALELRIPLTEANYAQMLGPENLDAWGLYHLGVRHMYRYNQADNAIAEDYFKRAIERSPNFSRAYAGLSHTNFQIAFQGYGSDMDHHAKLAGYYAEKGLELDPLDPMANLIMGRFKWLTCNPEEAIQWIDRANELNPNYAFALYAGSVVNAILGASDTGETLASKAMSLSPLDPNIQSILTIRAFNSFLVGEEDKARELASKAIAAANKYKFIYLLNSIVFSALGDGKNAQYCADEVKKSDPSFDQATFFHRFDFRDDKTMQVIKSELNKLGF